MTIKDDLEEAAADEIGLAGALGWRELARLTPWGDTFEGFTPQGRTVCFERNYLWEGIVGGDIRVELHVYEPQAYEQGVRLTRTIKSDAT